MTYTSFTSSGEQDNTAMMTPMMEDPGEPGDDDDPMPTPEDPIKNSLTGHVQFFWPLFQGIINDEKYDYFGLTGLVGGQQTEGEDHVAGRYYLGFRWAQNPEMFFDVLYGRTESLRSDRFELHAQMPLFVFDNGTRFYFGAKYNIGISSEKHGVIEMMDGMPVLDADMNPVYQHPLEGDSIQYFIQWRLDPLALFNRYSGGD
jgi:hypothetical protein